MGQVVSFENHAVARLRDRLGAAETARADLIAFARGHSEAVATIHDAVLHALEAESLTNLLELAARDWPALLDVDAVVIAVAVGKQGFRVDRQGVSFLDPALIASHGRLSGAVSRGVERGHALFGADACEIRSEALIPVFGADPSMPAGLLLLGQRSPVDPGSAHGAQLLEFLGQFLAAMMRRWLTLPNPGPTTMVPTPPAL